MLYDKVYRADVLAHAYHCVKYNGGSAGADGQTYEQIESQGLEQWLGELTQALGQVDLAEPPEQVKRMNDRLEGWSNSFRLGSVSKAYRAVDQQARSRIRQWLRRKHQSKHRDYRRYSNDRLHEEVGLTRLESRRQSFPWATA